jgi:hypothetical protein
MIVDKTAFEETLINLDKHESVLYKTGVRHFLGKNLGPMEFFCRDGDIPPEYFKTYGFIELVKDKPNCIGPNLFSRVKKTMASTSVGDYIFIYCIAPEDMAEIIIINETITEYLNSKEHSIVNNSHYKTIDNYWGLAFKFMNK